MRREDEAAPGYDRRQRTPHDALGADVHAGRRLVEEENRGVAHEGDGEGEFTLVAAGELGGHTVLEELEADGADDFADIVFDILNASDAGIEAQMLEHGHLVAGVDLRADAEGVAGGGAVFADRDILDKDLA